MHKFFITNCFLIISLISFSQDVFDVGVRQIEIFFNEPIGMILLIYIMLIIMVKDL